MTELNVSAGKIVKSRPLRKKQKLYDDALDDDELVGKRTFSLEEKLLKTEKPGQKFYIEMEGSDLTLKFFQQNGFSRPILVKDKSGLGMRLPSTNFSVADVKRCVGSLRMLDVVDVTTQQDLVMTVKDWVRYYENKERERLLNVISLEFSHTRLENYIDQPQVIHQLDWVDLAWPWYLRQFHREPTNLIDKMKYPKVQKYCLMSVKGCYTDFHIDMGGTSVWYHILKGKKIFWFIPPTEKNLQLFENWTLSGKQGDIFFGDLVSNCYYVHLEAGWTFFIPPGWIHAVYTPKDSLVFGGNFLHSYNIRTQLRVWEVESKTHVPSKFRYPFFVEMHWYVLERYVSCLTGKCHRVDSAEEHHLVNNLDDEVDETKEEFSETDSRQNSTEKSSRVRKVVSSSGMDCDNILIAKEINSDLDQLQKLDSASALSLKDSPSRLLSKMSGLRRWTHLTSYELEGIQAVIEWLEALPHHKSCVPKDIPDALLLLSDAKKLLDLHQTDDHLKSITGTPTLKQPVPKILENKTHHKASLRAKKPVCGRDADGVRRHRRIRCKNCEPCTRSDCGDCQNCKDMKKFGGLGRRKQTCESRQCLAPLLPHKAVCHICGKSETDLSEAVSADSSLMECRECFNICHPRCLKGLNPDLLHPGIVDEDLPNSWDCSRCCEVENAVLVKQNGVTFSSGLASCDRLSIESSHQQPPSLLQLASKLDQHSNKPATIEKVSPMQLTGIHFSRSGKRLENIEQSSCSKKKARQYQDLTVCVKKIEDTKFTAFTKVQKKLPKQEKSHKTLSIMSRSTSSSR